MWDVRALPKKQKKTPDPYYGYHYGGNSQGKHGQLFRFISVLRNLSVSSASVLPVSLCGFKGGKNMFFFFWIITIINAQLFIMFPYYLQ